MEKMKKPGLTLTVVFEAQSANYGEGVGNVASLKTLTRGDGKSYSYISRQALRYSIVKQLAWDNTPTTEAQKVIQFKPDASIEKYPEIDLFGYMKTEKSKGAATRSAVARLSHAVSLEDYRGDTDFLTNMGLAKRDNKENAIAQSENHKSLYAYTLTVDLDRVGVETEMKDGKEIVTLNIDKAEKARRVTQLLETLKTLYRDIRGRRENLNPVFVIGGVYEIKNPYFADRIKLNKLRLDIDLLKDSIAINDDAAKNTRIGMLSSTFSNESDVKNELKPLSVKEFFDKIIEEVKAQYA